LLLGVRIMFNVPLGELSARVTLLQLLLNSHDCFGADGKRLTVDGAYGPNTKAAVSSASRLMRVGDPKGNAAPPELIKALLADVDLKVISSVDLGDPKLEIALDALKEAGDDPIVLGGLCNGLQQLVNEITSRAGPGRTIALRLEGHGNLGRWLTVSVGSAAHLKGEAYQEIENEVMSYISSSNFNTVSSVIAPLSRLFAPFGFAEHRGCTLGARRETRAMLKKLADLWGSPFESGLTCNQSRRWILSDRTSRHFPNPTISRVGRGSFKISISQASHN
jgi:hypothetical protein